MTAGGSYAGGIVLRGVLLAVLAVAGAGCSSPAPQISIDDPAAELSPVFVGAGSIYLKIRNSGGRDALTGAAVNLPKAVVELHEVKDGRMVRVERVAVPARGDVALGPGSLHIMVFNMPKAVQKGSEIELTLRFERSGERKIAVPIRQ